MSSGERTSDPGAPRAAASSSPGLLRTPSSRRWRWALTVALAVAVLVRLWLVSAQSIHAMGLANHDDRLFLNLAAALLRGEWLGSYDRLTLAKGPFYPAWVVAMFSLGVPLLLSEQLLYTAACALCAVSALRPAVRSGGARAALFLLLLFNPASWADSPATRVVREGIYPALSLLVFGAVLGLLLRWRRRNPPWAWACLAGFAGGAYWMTREEGAWLFPALLVLVGMALLRSWRMGWRRPALLLTVSLGIALASQAAVSLVNWQRYGVFAVVEFRERPFLSAYGALARIEHARWRPWVHVPREVRERAYAVSPAFSRLRPSLEGRVGTWWLGPGCTSWRICDELAGGTFMWALRDAAQEAGVHADGRTAARYYRQVAAEIDAACEDGRLVCSGRRASMMPPWRREFAAPLWRATIRSLAFMARYEEVTPSPSASFGTDDLLVLFRDLTRDRLSGDEAEVIVTGWAVVEDGGALSLALRAEDGAQGPVSIERFARPDLKPGAFGFTVQGRCAGRCALVVGRAEAVFAAIPATTASGHQDQVLRVWIDHATTGRPAQARLDAPRLRALTAITRTYGALTPWLAILGGLASLVVIGRLAVGRRPPLLFDVALAASAAVLARALVIGLIHTTSFWAIGPVYLSAGYPFILLFVGSALGALVERPAAPAAG